VLLGIYLDMTAQVIHERGELVIQLPVQGGDLVEHVGDQVFPAERERGRLAVNRGLIDELPGGGHELDRGLGRARLLERRKHRLAVAQ
jgi:hypothetical protein